MRDKASIAQQYPELSERVRSLPASGVRGVFDRANFLESEGRPIIHMEIGRPWFDTPTFIKNAAKEALDQGQVHYSPTRGIQRLREVIAEKVARENGIHADPESEIIVTCGNKQATFLAMCALLDPGDEVVLTDPHYGPHLKEALFLGAVPRLLSLAGRNRWELGAEDVKRAVGPKTKAIIINTPHNPSGRVFTLSELRAVAESATDNDAFVITDETYEYFAYDGLKHISMAALDGMRQRTVSTFALTKSYAMDGWRLGYVVAPPWIISGMSKVVQLDTAGPNTFAQYGAVEAIKSGAAGALHMVEADQLARDYTLQRLRSIDLPCRYVEGTIYAFPTIEGLGLTDEEFCRSLLEDYNVALTPGSAFGAQGKEHVRIAFGAVPIEALKEGLERIERFVGELRSRGAGCRGRP